MLLGHSLLALPDLTTKAIFLRWECYVRVSSYRSANWNETLDILQKWWTKMAITSACLVLKAGWVCKPPRFLDAGAPTEEMYSWSWHQCGPEMDCGAVQWPLASLTSLRRLSVLVARTTGSSWQFAQVTVTCHQPEGGTWSQTLREGLRTMPVPWAVSESNNSHRWGGGAWAWRGIQNSVDAALEGPRCCRHRECNKIPLHKR